MFVFLDEQEVAEDEDARRGDHTLRLRTKKESPPPKKKKKKNQKQTFYSTSDCVFTLPMQDMDAAMEEDTDGRDTDTEDMEERGAGTAENVSLQSRFS